MDQLALELLCRFLTIRPGISEILEHILQRELYLAHVGARAIDPAESLGGYADIGITPVRMVREVERLEPELERVILDDPELLMG